MAWILCVSNSLNMVVEFGQLSLEFGGSSVVSCDLNWWDQVKPFLDSICRSSVARHGLLLVVQVWPAMP